MLAIRISRRFDIVSILFLGTAYCPQARGSTQIEGEQRHRSFFAEHKRPDHGSAAQGNDGDRRKDKMGLRVEVRLLGVGCEGCEYGERRSKFRVTVTSTCSATTYLGPAGR
jgi:hypothetical protein